MGCASRTPHGNLGVKKRVNRTRDGRDFGSKAKTIANEMFGDPLLAGRRVANTSWHKAVREFACGEGDPAVSRRGKKPRAKHRKKI